MSNFHIFIKTLTGKEDKTIINQQMKIADIRHLISKNKKIALHQLILKYKGAILEDKLKVIDYGIQQGDEIIFIKKILPKQQSQTQVQSNSEKEMKIEYINETEDQFQELINLGYEIELIKEALLQSNGDYLNALCILADQHNKNTISLETPIIQPTSYDIYKCVLQEQIVSELRHQVSNEIEWNKTINVIKEQNSQLYQLIYNNKEQFRHLQLQNNKNQKNELEINEQDLGFLYELREVNLNKNDTQILEAYLLNDRDPYSTVNYLQES